MPLILTNRFINGEVADAVPVDGNDQAIQSYINSEVITADGLTQMRAPLLLRSGDPTQPNHAANKDYVDAQMPIGTMLMWPAVVPPAGSKWHLCDGGALATSAYAILFGLLDYKYGGSGGSFLLPNLQGRFPIGFDATKTAFDVIGEAGGTFTVPVPAHAHDMPHEHGLSITTSVETSAHTHGISPTGTITTSSDGAHSHNSAYINHSLPTAGTEGVDRSMNAAPPYPTGYLQAGTDVQGAHTHTYSGNTSVEQALHTHAVNGVTNAITAAATANNSAALTPTGVTTTMVQPYLPVNFIIRII